MGAATSSVLSPGADINGVLFDGSANIVVTAAAGTLTGTTLNSTVLTSSLTTIGTIGTGVWQGTIIGTTYGGTGADSHASTGVAQVSAGTWSWSTALAAGTTATTQSTGDNTTKVATDAFVNSSIAAISPASTTLTGDVTGTGTGTIATTVKTSISLAGNPTTTTQSSSDNSTKIATTAYVTTAITAALNGLDWKPAVGYATTANVVGTNLSGIFTYTSTGTDTIDGHTLVLNDQVLFKNQISQADNGVWVVTTAGSLGIAGVLTRRSDYNTAAEIAPGDTFYVINGTTNANTAWAETATVTIIDSDAINFSQVAGPGTYVAGSGLLLTGNSFSIPSAAVTNAMLAGSITAANLVGTDIATLGTITAGTWHGSVVAPAYGGTGIANNAASTITISGSYSTTLTVTGTTALTLPTAGQVMVSNTTGVTGGTLITNMMSMTAAAYALITPDSTTLYFING